MSKLLLLLTILNPALGLMWQNECWWCLLVSGTLVEVKFSDSEQPFLQCLRNSSHSSFLFSLQNVTLTTDSSCTWKKLWTPDTVNSQYNEDNYDLLKKSIEALITIVASDKNGAQDEKLTAVLVQIFMILLALCFISFQLLRLSACRELFLTKRPRKPHLSDAEAQLGWDEVDFKKIDLNKVDKRKLYSSPTELQYKYDEVDSINTV